MFTSTESRWHAVVKRDQAAEGKFYYAVKTTGVYCRPGCASRRPHRENVGFFDSCADAERAGYRACKRCRPNSASARERRVQMVARACRDLERAQPVPTFEQLARTAGLSPWHFHRLFKEIVGITPKKYAATHRMQRFRRGLKHNGSVTAAIYAAGFGSSARAYRNAADQLGMTPSVYRSGAGGITMRYATARCFLGAVIVAVSDRGICAIELGDSAKVLCATLQSRFPKATLVSAGCGLSAIVEEVVGFIDAPEKRFNLPLDIQGTAFEQRVWSALRRIPHGTTESYSDIARRIGQPRAVRAVARACAANKIAVVIPCHRVVRSDGELSGYRWGAQRKRALLVQEQSEPANRRRAGMRARRKRSP